jgi:glutathione synthase/RimK-type ligase-like ATP-grasp enzyme
MSNNPVKIAYMNNPDPVFFNKLDKVLADNLKSLGAEVIQFELKDIYFKMNPGKISFYLKDQNDEFVFDGFMFYGHMSQQNDIAFNYLLTAMEKSGKLCLHSVNAYSQLNNKFLQALDFSKGKLTIPTTYSAYSIPSMINVVDMHFKKLEPSIGKSLSDYGGDGVRKCLESDCSVNSFAKSYWKKEYDIIQKFIPDSLGKSIRVFCVGNNPIAIVEYNDQTGDFRSNIAFESDYKLIDLKNSEKKDQYFEIASKASKSIGNLIVCGVDLMDSKENGINVIEVNPFPDLNEISHVTSIDVISEFIKMFYERVIGSKH